MAAMQMKGAGRVHSTMRPKRKAAADTIRRPKDFSGDVLDLFAL
jgi:hypothetical protein